MPKNKEPTVTKIVWGNHSYKGDAEKVAAEIKSIGDEVKPQDIVDYAEKHKTSELYKCFTWDDTEAAKKWRLHEARNIVCNLKLVIVEQELPNTEFRLMMRNDYNGGYKETTVMHTDRDEYAKMLTIAKNELIAFEKKYKTLTELECVFDAIESILKV